MHILPLIIIALLFVVFFFVVPQLVKFRATTGIDQKLVSDELPVLQKIWLMMLGLKTPFLTTLSTLFSFVTTEGDKLVGFGWDQFMSHEHAAMVSAGLWFATLWAHFSGLNAAAALPPVAVPASPAAPKV